MCFPPSVWVFFLSSFSPNSVPSNAACRTHFLDCLFGGIPTEMGKLIESLHVLSRISTASFRYNAVPVQNGTGREGWLCAELSEKCALTEIMLATEMYRTGILRPWLLALRLSAAFFSRGCETSPTSALFDGRARACDGRTWTCTGSRLAASSAVSPQYRTTNSNRRIDDSERIWHPLRVCTRVSSCCVRWMRAVSL